MLRLLIMLKNVKNVFPKISLVQAHNFTDSQFISFVHFEAQILVQLGLNFRRENLNFFDECICTETGILSHAGFSFIHLSHFSKITLNIE